MKKIKLASLVIICVAITLTKTSFSQTGTKPLIKPLYKGDKVPDFSLGKMVNYKSSTAKFSDFKGKLVIFDFWATWCSPCVASLPKMDSLQKYFGDKIAIIPVDGLGRNETPELVKKFFTEKKLKIPSVVEDTIIHKMFRHSGIPHEVWISGDGIVLATTDDKEVNIANIEKYFQMGVGPTKQKIDDINYKPMKPIFVNGNGGSGEPFISRSIFTRKVENISSSGLSQEVSIKNKQLMIKSVSIHNQDLIDHYYAVLLKGEKPVAVNPTRIIMETKDSSFHPMDYRFVTSTFWKEDSLYCYSLNLAEPIDNRTFYHDYMLHDLNRYQSKMRGRIEKRKIPSLVFFRTDTTLPLLAAKDDTLPSRRFFSGVETEYLDKVQNLEFDNLIDYLGLYFYSAPPIYNETGLTKERVNMPDVHIKVSKDKAEIKKVDVEEWRKAFRKYGLDIKIEDRETEIVVITLIDQKK